MPQNAFIKSFHQKQTRGNVKSHIFEATIRMTGLQWSLQYRKHNKYS